MAMNSITMGLELYAKMQAYYAKRYVEMMIEQGIDSPPEYPAESEDLRFLCLAIADSVVNEVKKATLTLNFLKGDLKGTVVGPVKEIISAAPGAPITGVGTFYPTKSAPVLN